MSRTSRRPTSNGPRPTLRAALAVGVTGLLWTALPLIYEWRQQGFAERLARHAERQTGSAARSSVRRLAEMGMPALGALTALARLDDSDAADAAREMVQNQLAGWETEFAVARDSRRFAERLEALAAALDRPAPSAGGAIWTAQIGSQIVKSCDRLPPQATFDLLARCDRLFLASDASPPRPTPAQPTSSTAAPTVDPPSERHVAAPPPELAESAVPSLPLVADADVRLLEPAPLSAAPFGEHGPQLEALGALRSDLQIGKMPLATEPRPIPPPRLVPPPAAAPSVVDVPSPQEARAALRQLRKLPARELAQRRANAAPYEVLAIEQVLAERAARQSSRPVRRTGANGSDVESLDERLSRLPASEARRLLRALAVDDAEDPELRLQALTLLATSGDARLREIARRRAVEDADPRVAELAMRILREGAAR